MPDPKKHSYVWLTWVARVIVGAAFTFSGFTKAIDPWGTIYKMVDYLAAMDFSMVGPVVVAGAFILCMLEFLVGLMILLGCFRRGAAWLSVAIMAVMLPLTLWIYVSNPVADCGCFGDAWVISNGATFWKNVLLSACAVWLALHPRQTNWFVAPQLQWLALFGSAIFILGIELWGYHNQPLLDFRPYPVGTKLVAHSTNSADEPTYRFIYSLNGEKHDFSIDSLPDESQGWVFEDRYEVGSKSEENQPSEGIRIWDGDEDVTEDVLYPEQQRIMLLVPELKDVSISASYKINALYDLANHQGADMFAAVAADPEEIDNWQDLSLASYPIYTADDTSLKEVARGNPAVVYLRNDSIIWKSSLRWLDADLIDGNPDYDLANFQTDGKRILLNASMLLCAFLACLIFLSFSPGLARRLFARRSPKNPSPQ